MLLQFLVSILALGQAAQPAQILRFREYQIVVPQGWRALDSGPDFRIVHVSGASLQIIQSRQTQNLEKFSRDAVERIMTPLGFAKFGEPRSFHGDHEDSIQYEIRGNRLSDHRRILYRAVRSDKALVETVYENSEEGFDKLLSEAQSIASTLQAVPEPAPRGRGVRPAR